MADEDFNFNEAFGNNVANVKQPTPRPASAQAESTEVAENAPEEELEEVELNEDDAAPEVAPEEAPEAAPEEAPEVAPEEAPEAAPEEAPEAAPEEAPEATLEVPANMPPIVPLNMSLVGVNDEELVRMWNAELNTASRARIVAEMEKRDLFPKDYVDKITADGGLYPDSEDPNFISRLLSKAEFADTASAPFDIAENPCQAGPDFEVTPVQRFVANFMHPNTPYMSMLLYHGVGVGKTCAAIQAAEAYLDVYPRKKVIIVAPPNIQPGFIRTIFDPERLVIGKGDQLNKMNGCTGDTYFRLTGTGLTREKDDILRRVRNAIKRRYEFFGYLQFRNKIREIIKTVSTVGTEEEVRFRQIDALKKAFNYRMLIVDEAHNLRDVGGTAIKGILGSNGEELDDVEDTDTVGTAEEQAEAKAGKQLTPYLRQLVESTDGMKLLCMTATPMFNSVLEIVFLFNLLLLNDKKASISMDKLLNEKGELVEGSDLILRCVASQYVSFMRGENPNSFPIRLLPQGELRLTPEAYPDLALSSAGKDRVPEEQKVATCRLPLVVSAATEISHAGETMIALTKSEVSAYGTRYNATNTLLQAGNCVYPVDSDDYKQRVGVKGFQNAFVKEGKSFRAVETEWLMADNLQYYSPKAATVLKSIKGAEGVCFIYSRFVISGALFLAHCLEANGYTAYGRSERYLANGIISPGGRQCALCPLREEEHAGAPHGAFVPAKFVLLTGDKDLSPKNKEAIDAARGEKNVDGGIVKVVIGSQIAGEGLDLRFIRENHIFDAWFHLNKTEQIIGRAIRFCSHSLIADKEKRNTTVYLHVLTLPETNMETADLQAYRTALAKAVLVGKVSRKMKLFAVDCNLRKEVTVLSGLPCRVQVDAQGVRRTGTQGDAECQATGRGEGILVDDMPFTAICDWMECETDIAKRCIPNITIDLESADDSTYSTFSAQYRETQLQRFIRNLFSRQPYYNAEELVGLLQETGVPQAAIDFTLQHIINNRMFRIRSGSREGYILYKNRYFIFQPDVYKDTTIPLALRIADFPIKRDVFTPKPIPREVPVMNEVKKAAETAQQVLKKEGQLEFWGHLMRWLDNVSSGRQTTVGIDIESKLELVVSNKAVRDVLLDKLTGIIIMKKKMADGNLFRQIVREYFWDEWVDEPTQLFFLQKAEDQFRDIAEENILTSGAIKAYRFVNGQTNMLDYFCDGAPCNPAIQDAFEESKDDPVKNRDNTLATTGNTYGFIVPKAGPMVFKTHLARVNLSEKFKGTEGKECVIVSASSEYFKKLIETGKDLVKYGHDAMGLDKDHLYAQDEIVNNKRACTVLELTLRYMDKLKLGGKRWFFRPLAAYYSGHRGKITQEARKIIESSKAEQKKRDLERKKAERIAAAAAKKVEKDAAKEREKVAKAAAAVEAAAGKAGVEEKPEEKPTTKPKLKRTFKFKTVAPKPKEP
jgi:hypothetical protein